MQLSELIKSTRKYDLTIFSAVRKNSGKEIYEVDGFNERKLDEHNRLIQKYDLHEIVNEFEIWAKEQKLSFWE
ncbi:hypothetical protein [Candidatus Thiodubiliella endoseptemdiera]|uniref:hypothetical protein n=1 Tax=Candidatus Thiodubiliella endoseptemdiera TaxID=2738886 RepID=UPI0034DE0421